MNTLKATNGVKEKESVLLTLEDEINIKNLFTNNIVSQAQDRKQVQELLLDEVKLLIKIKSIQTERDNLLVEKKKLLKDIKKLETNVG